jgi:branched-subunit amino acid transport protein
LTAFVATLVVGIGTYITRAVFILALAKRRIPDGVLLALQFVAPAVLASLIIDLLVNGDGGVAFGVPEVLALIAGGFVAFKTRNHILTLIVGMTVFWILRWVL